MKRFLAAAAAVLIAALVTGATIAADMVTQAKTTVMLAVPTGAEEKAMLTGLKPDALQMGLGEAVLTGVATQEAQADGTTRVTVQWHAIGLTSGAATQALTSPLMTQFRTGDKSVPPGTVVSVRGNLDALAEDYLKLKARLERGTPKDTVKQVNNNNTTTETNRGANELATTGGGGSAGSANAPYSFNSDNNKVKADMITTTWQDCQPRVDRAGAAVYQQARRVDVTDSGRVMSTGACEDHGTSAPIVRTYDKDCAPIVDIDNRKVYHQFIETAALEGGKTLTISTCTADFQKSEVVQATTVGCGYRHDFTAGKSVLQEKLFYNDPNGGAVVNVRDCGDSATAYTQYTTTNTCPPTVDTVNNQVFINQRVAFKDGNGAEQYAADCQPDGNPSIAIQQEFCTPKYEHDFTNHVSYYRTRAYYTSQAGSVIYVSECGRSAMASFSHAFQAADCSVTNDDAALMTKWFKKTYIDTPTDGTVEIAPCQEMGSPTPYAYVGEAGQGYSGGNFGGSLSSDRYQNTVATWPTLRSILPSWMALDSTTSSFSETLIGYTTIGMGEGYPLASTVGTISHNNGTLNADTVTSYMKTQWGYTRCTPAMKVSGTAYFPRYLRGDGSYYQKPESSRVALTQTLCYDEYQHAGGVCCGSW